MGMEDTGGEEGVFYDIQHEDSIFAVVVQPEGVASYFAHQHLIYACPDAIDAKLYLSEKRNNLELIRFSLSFPVAELQVDVPEVIAKWQKQISSLGIVSTPWKAISDNDRKAVRENMFSGSQLDCENYPSISATIASIKRIDKSRDSSDHHTLAKEEDYFNTEYYNHLVTVAVTIRGITLEKIFPARVEIPATRDVWDPPQQLSIVSVGEFNFTDFGIKPYSAFFGAVRNCNRFHIFVSVRAIKVRKT